MLAFLGRCVFMLIALAFALDCSRVARVRLVPAERVRQINCLGAVALLLDYGVSNGEFSNSLIKVDHPGFTTLSFEARALPGSKQTTRGARSAQRTAAPGIGVHLYFAPQRGAETSGGATIPAPFQGANYQMRRLPGAARFALAPG